MGTWQYQANKEVLISSTLTSQKGPDLMDQAQCSDRSTLACQLAYAWVTNKAEQHHYDPRTVAKPVLLKRAREKFFDVKVAGCQMANDRN
jgi:hypothetical protein